MKIAIVTYSLMIGGVESVIFNLGKGLKSRGFEVEIIETFKEGICKGYFLKNEFNVISIIQKPFITAVSHAMKLAAHLNKFDIILLNDSPLAQSTLGKLKPSILTFPIMHLSLDSMAFNASSNIGQWNKIVAVSPFLKEFLHNRNQDLKEEDIVCITNGVDIKKFAPVYNEKRIAKKIVFIGRLTEQKGIRLIPSVIDKIKDHANFDCLDIYGTGPLCKELKHEIEKFNLSDKVIIKGSVVHENVAKLLRDYDILFLPSFYEGLSIVLLEAMSCGLVPVVSRLPGSSDTVVEHGVNGYLTEIGDVGQFANNLTQAIENPYLYQMAERASKTINSKFSSDQMVEAYLSLFKCHKNCILNRTRRIELSLLGDFPRTPYFLVRLIRKVTRILKQFLVFTLI